MLKDFKEDFEKEANEIEERSNNFSVIKYNKEFGVENLIIYRDEKNNVNRLLVPHGTNVTILHPEDTASFCEIRIHNNIVAFEEKNLVSFLKKLKNYFFRKHI